MLWIELCKVNNYNVLLRLLNYLFLMIIFSLRQSVSCPQWELESCQLQNKPNQSIDWWNPVTVLMILMNYLYWNVQLLYDLTIVQFLIQCYKSLLFALWVLITYNFNPSEWNKTCKWLELNCSLFTWAALLRRLSI